MSMSSADGCVLGTLTKAEQNVPQAKPDVAALNVLPSAESRTVQRL
jgi:hypothetical protein